MPHIMIEYSANIAEHHDVDALVSAVHNAAIGHGLPPVDGLRTRAAVRDHFRIAIAIRIGPGRDAATKTGFIETVLDAAESQLDAEFGPLAIAWSIELNEIDANFRINRNHVRTRLAQRAATAQEAPSHG